MKKMIRTRTEETYELTPEGLMKLLDIDNTCVVHVQVTQAGNTCLYIKVIRESSHV